MRGISAGLATCAIVAMVAGCGTVSSSSQGVAAHPSGSSAAGGQGSGAATATPASAATATPADAGKPSGCPGSGSAAPKTVTITLAANGKTYCLHVGDKLRIYLRGTDSSRWLPPVANSSTLEPAPDPARLLARGVTGGSFAAVRPGQVLVTSVRPPCRVAITPGKDGIEPADPLPRMYPLQFCAPGHRFSAWIIVLRST